MFNALNVLKEWNIPQKHPTNSCFNVAILTMASPSALSQLIKQELTRLRTSPEMEVVEGGKVAVLMVAMDRVVAMVMVINPAPVASGKAMIKLYWLSPPLVVLENIRESGA
jgi:hypothetical protein